MFTKEITNSDEFIDMPLSSQALYFHLAMNADDDGFVSPKSIIRMVQAKDDDLKILLFKKFVICFETWVIVISHWKCNNTLRWDRYKQTLYQNEYKQLCNNGWVYTMATVGIPNGNQMATVGMHSIVESRVDKSREVEEENQKPNKFIPPSLEQVKTYFLENWYRDDVAIRAYNGYNVADRHDTHGKKVRNRKQKMQNVRFKEENKNKTQVIQEQKSKFTTEADAEKLLFSIHAKWI